MKKFYYTLLLSLFFFVFITTPKDCMAEDVYSTSFNSSHINICSPQKSGISCDGILSISGTSDLKEVWFCTRGPHNELANYQADIKDGNFTIDINLRFGPGEYTVWAGDNSQHFDGKIRFLLKNEAENDTRYTSASRYVDSTNSDIVKLAESLAPSGLDEWDKLKNIHDWIAANISYDYDNYFSEENREVSASQVLKDKKGICRDYAFLLAALCRAAGLSSRVVYGEVEVKPDSRKGLHAWNEVKVNGEWTAVDVCWDAGYVKNNRFIAAASSKFFALGNNEFATTHTVTTTTLH